MSGNIVGLPDITTHIHPMAISWGLSMFAANGAAWNALPADLRALLKRELPRVEHDVWNESERDTADGVACNIGAPGCKEGKPGHMTEVRDLARRRTPAPRDLRGHRSAALAAALRAAVRGGLEPHDGPQHGHHGSMKMRLAARPARSSGRPPACCCSRWSRRGLAGRWSNAARPSQRADQVVAQTAVGAGCRTQPRAAVAGPAAHQPGRPRSRPPGAPTARWTPTLAHRAIAAFKDRQLLFNDAALVDADGRTLAASLPCQRPQRHAPARRLRRTRVRARACRS